MKGWVLYVFLLSLIHIQKTNAQQDSIINDTTTKRKQSENVVFLKKKDKILPPAIVVGLIIAGTILLFNVRSR